MKFQIAAIICLLAFSQSARSQRIAACAGLVDRYFVRSADCSSYYFCSNGVATLGQCPNGFLFNAQTQVCDFGHVVDCTQCSPYGAQNIADPFDCKQYYRCAAGQRSTRTCGFGLLFDRSIGDCNVESLVQCDQRNRICEQFSSYGEIIIGNPDNCNSFFLCNNGYAFEQFCNPQFFFNPYTAQCEPGGSFNFCQGDGPIITTPRPDAETPPPNENDNEPETTVSTEPTPTTSPTPPPSWTLPPLTLPPQNVPTVNPDQLDEQKQTIKPQNLQLSTTKKPTVMDSRCRSLHGTFGLTCTEFVTCHNGQVMYVTKCIKGYFWHENVKKCTETLPVGCSPWRSL